jgi:hypothetical protein
VRGVICALDRFDLKIRQRRRNRVDDRNQKGRGSGALGQERGPVEPLQLIEIESLQLIEIESLRIRAARLVKEGRSDNVRRTRSQRFDQLGEIIGILANATLPSFPFDPSS